ncbi:MAG: hypothetical protein ACOC1P_02715 [Minisyncoccales bacterium]
MSKNHSKNQTKKIAGKTGLEAYEPKKNIIEKIKDTPKMFIFTILIITIVFVSVFSTYYTLKSNPELAEKVLGIKSDTIKRFSTTTSQDDTSSNENVNQGKSSTKNPTPDLDNTNEKTSESEENKETDYSTLKQDILESSFIDDLPKKGKIVLSFYNFYTGEREWEKHYILKKNSVEEGQTSDRDMRILMHSKYVTKLRDSDICDVIGNAKENGDLGIETEESKTSLTFKYRSMMDYKECLGM